MLSKALMAAAGTTEEIQFSDDVFSTYLYTGNLSTQTITNGINLAGKGGTVWFKSRGPNTYNHTLFYTGVGTSGSLRTNTTDGLPSSPTGLTSFNSDGFSISGVGDINQTSENMVAWTFRHAAKFYNTATLTKSPGVNATVSFPTLGTLGMVRVKRTDAAGSWYVWHRSATAGHLLIGETAAASSANGMVTVSGTTVTLVDAVIANGQYLIEAFAHDSSPEGLIQCGSFTTNGSGNATVNLGWEPQYVMAKKSTGTGNWDICDSMRAFTSGGTGTTSLLANTTGVEAGIQCYAPESSGVKIISQSTSQIYIYMAIRRPNKPPTTGTQVYSSTATNSSSLTSVGFTPDLFVLAGRGTGDPFGTKTFVPRLTGSNGNYSNATAVDNTCTSSWDKQDSFIQSFSAISPASSYFFKRAPGVFDVVCYTGGNGIPQQHSLGVAPEMVWIKARTAESGLTLQNSWYVQHKDLPLSGMVTILLNSGSGPISDYGLAFPATGTTFGAGTGASQNGRQAGVNYVAYLFATKTGVSKVGIYTGNGSSQTVNCSFTSGARFILIKRTDSTGDWYVWDTTRGIVAGNDPHLSLNTIAAEVTTDDSIDPDSTGFIVNQVAATNINVTSATYIYLAIA